MTKVRNSKCDKTQNPKLYKTPKQKMQQNRKMWENSKLKIWQKKCDKTQNEDVHFTLCVLCHMSHVTCHLSPVTCHLWHVTCQHFLQIKTILSFLHNHSHPQSNAINYKFKTLIGLLFCLQTSYHINVYTFF